METAAGEKRHDGTEPAGKRGGGTDAGGSRRRVCGNGGDGVILKLQNICKDYIQGKMEVPVLHDICFSMRKGRIRGPSWDPPVPARRPL